MITIDPPDESFGGSWLAAMRAFLARATSAVPVGRNVSVLLTTDRRMRQLNRTFRHQDHATDVLSFPAATFQQAFAGDLAVSLPTARRQAKRLGHSLEVELKILILHGLLHLAGYDHEADRGEMAVREEELRRRFRLPVGLIGRNAHGSAEFARRGRR